MREALQMFSEAVEASGGKHAEALFELGLASQKAGENHQAADFYQRAIVQSKDRIPACHNNLGVIMATSGKLDEAMREFEIALKLSKGKFKEARENITRCRNMFSGPSAPLLAVSTGRN